MFLYEKTYKWITRMINGLGVVIQSAQNDLVMSVWNYRIKNGTKRKIASFATFDSNLGKNHWIFFSIHRKTKNPPWNACLLPRKSNSEICDVFNCHRKMVTNWFCVIHEWRLRAILKIDHRQWQLDSNDLLEKNERSVDEYSIKVNAIERGTIREAFSSNMFDLESLRTVRIYEKIFSYLFFYALSFSLCWRFCALCAA